jgi:hypothetical protein
LYGKDKPSIREAIKIKGKIRASVYVAPITANVTAKARDKC